MCVVLLPASVLQANLTQFVVVVAAAASEWLRNVCQMLWGGPEGGDVAWGLCTERPPAGRKTGGRMVRIEDGMSDPDDPLRKTRMLACLPVCLANTKRGAAALIWEAEW